MKKTLLYLVPLFVLFAPVLARVPMFSDRAPASAEGRTEASAAPEQAYVRARLPPLMPFAMPR